MFTVTLVDTKDWTGTITSYTVDTLEEAVQAVDYWKTVDGIRAVALYNG